MPTQDRPAPAPRKLTLSKETLRRLTRPELRRAAGGAIPSHGCPPGPSDRCWSDYCWTWNCPSQYPNCPTPKL